MIFGRLAPITFFSVVWVVSFFPYWAVSAATMLQPPTTPVRATFFGLHMHSASENNWPSVPFGGWRLWDAHTTWRELEPQRGQWNFQELDKDVALAEAHNVELMFTLGMTPAWASARPAEGPPNRPGSTAEPRDLNDWREYVRTLASRYRGKIHIYEIWNEPNGYGFFRAGPEKMAPLAREAYTILHQVDPSVTVVSPSPSGSGLAFLEAYLRDGGGKYADVIGYHFYVTPSAPEAMLDLIAKVKGTMAEYGQSRKPLWNTETGYFIQSQTTEVKAQGPFVVLTSDQAAAYVARAYILNWAAGVERLYWYDWDSDVMGLGDAKGTKRKEAANAYEKLERWLLGAVMTSCSSDASDTWVCEITREGHYGGHIVWNPHGNRNFTIPAAWGVRWQVNLTSPDRSLSGAKSTEIGIKPILLENKA